METIVVGTDGSPSSMDAVRQAAELAKATGARLHIACAAHLAAELAAKVMEPIIIPDDFDQQALDAARAAVDGAADLARGSTDAIEGHVLHGEAANALVELCKELHADLLVVGSHGMTGPARFLLGSVANRCAHHAKCSVMVARARR